MSMRRRIFGLAVVAATILAAAVPVWAADGGGGTATVTAAVGTSNSIFGSRSITSVTPTVGLTLQAGTSNMTGQMAVVVTETARTGTAAWSVTAVLDGDMSDGGSPANTIDRGNLSITGNAPTVLGGGGTPSAGAGGTLGQARTLFSVNGQSTSLNYSGTYTSLHTITLSVPNQAKTGVYSGTLTVSLVQ